MKIAIVNALETAVERLRLTLEPASHQICWVAREGSEALEKAEHERPDVVLLDVLLPARDAVAVTRRLVEGCGCAVLIVTQDVDQVAHQVFLALQAGALDADSVGSGTLLEKIANAASLVVPVPVSRTQMLVAIGASVGGPQALGRVLARLPATFPAAVVIVQHIDRAFSADLVKLLDGQTPLPVIEVKAGHRPAPGQVLVAGGTDHLVLTPNGRLSYAREPVGGLYRPSIDVFFASLSSWKGPLVGVLLTGMGADGAQGLLRLRQAGHLTLAQDESTSAIYGMPRAAAQLGAAARVLPLEAIGPALVACVGL